MQLRPEEPPAGPWQIRKTAAVVKELMGGHSHSPGPFLLGVDGRSSSGKSTLAERFRRVVAGSAVVHTDDVAWHHSIFGWDDVLRAGVIEPLRRGEPVRFRPPAWNERDRPGAIEAPATSPLVVIEGVGVGRHLLRPFLDALVWVQTDQAEVERREAARAAAGEVSEEVQAAWMAEEIPFLAEQRPWEHADLIVAGSPTLAHDPKRELVVADGFAGRTVATGETARGCPPAGR